MGKEVIYLEEHVHDEYLVALVSEGIEAIGQRGKNSDENTHHHDALEKSTYNCISANSHCVSEKKHADATEDTGCTHEYEAEFWLAETKSVKGCIKKKKRRLTKQLCSDSPST